MSRSVPVIEIIRISTLGEDTILVNRENDIWDVSYTGPEAKTLYEMWQYGRPDDLHLMIHMLSELTGVRLRHEPLTMWRTSRTLKSGRI